MFKWLGRVFPAGGPPAPAATAVNSDAAEERKTRGNAHFSKGELDSAAACYRQAVELNPDYAEAYNNLGRVFLEQKQYAEAERHLKRAAALNPRLADAHYNLGLVAQEQGRPDEAPAHYKMALEIQPDCAETHYSLGNALKELGQLDDAVASYHRALEIEPDYAEAHNNLGIFLQDIGQFDGAVASYHRALAIKPDYAEAHYNLGNVLKDLGQFDDAVASCHRALEIEPDYAEAYNNLGSILKSLGQLDGAAANYRRALEIKPDFVEARSNLGSALQESGQLDDAAASYAQALEIKPDFAEIHFNLGLCLLEMGRYSEGWQEFEYRWEGGKLKPPRPAIALPQWAGQQHSPGDRLLVFEEQGMGDRLQFARYLPLAADRFAGGVSLVSSPPLLALFRRSFPDVEILEAIPADQSAWQWQCPLLSLPLAFGTTLETIPKQVPCLVPDPVRVARWQARIAGLGLPVATRKIGVVWKTGNFMKTASLRTLTLQQLAPLLDLPGCVWLSLQKEPDPDKAPWVASGKLIDWAGEFGDFDDTAALAVNLDLIVSVDTAMAHLAGGLGLPTWLFNRHASEWRWMHDREDSLWYPTLRIFTQEKAGEWDEVVGRMAAAVREPALGVMR